jgi:sugar phosphate isomerase/epimerase
MPPNRCPTSVALLLSLTLATSYANAAGAAAGNVASADSGGPVTMAPWLARRLAIQLYSFHNQVDRDLPGTLRRIHELGFQRVEVYPVNGVAAATMRSALDQAGLRAISAHVDLEALRTRLPAVIADAQVLGVKQVGVAWIKAPGSDPRAPLSLSEADEVVSLFKSVCKPLRAAGLRLFLHNHGFEFGVVDSQTLLDRIVEAVEPKCLDLEIDVFWAASAGVDPVQLIQKHGPRVCALHLKDLPNDSVALGDGSLAMGAIVAAAKAARVDYLIVEDESLDSDRQIQRSLEFLRQQR